MNISARWTSQECTMVLSVMYDEYRILVMNINKHLSTMNTSVMYDGHLSMYTYDRFNSCNQDYYLLLLKPAAQAQVEKTKLVINCFRNPTGTWATKSWRKHNSWMLQTVDCTLEPIQCSGIKHSGREGHSTVQPGPAGNTLQFGTFYTLKLQTPTDELWPHLGYV